MNYSKNVSLKTTLILKIILDLLLMEWGEFNGLCAYIKQENQHSVYIWCYAHILNLCVCDTFENLAAKNVFGLLNRLETFFLIYTKRWVLGNKFRKN